MRNQFMRNMRDLIITPTYRRMLIKTFWYTVVQRIQCLTDENIATIRRKIQIHAHWAIEPDMKICTKRIYDTNIKMDITWRAHHLTDIHCQYIPQLSHGVQKQLEHIQQQVIGMLNDQRTHTVRNLARVICASEGVDGAWCFRYQ